MPSILLFDYDPAWPQRFEAEKARILGVIGQYASAVEHVGSTSVPGLGSKPTIDVLIGLPDFAMAERCIEPLRTLGYGYMGDVGIPQRYFFRKPDSESWEERRFNLHMTPQSSREWQRMIAFRDYLRTHPDAVQEYYELKKLLAVQYADDLKAYPEGKTAFVEGILAKVVQSEGLS